MAVTVAQSNKGNSSSGSTCAATFSGNTTTGNTIVAVAAGYDGATLRTVSSIAISPGSASFAKVIAQAGVASTYACTEGWAGPNVVGGTLPTVTVTFSGAITSADIFIYELAGVPTTTTQDGTAAGKAGTVATACTAPSITTTGSNTIIFAAFTPSDVMTAGEATWTNQIGTANSGLTEYKIETAPQTALVATATQNSNLTYGAIVFALKGAVSGSVPSESVNPGIISP